MRLVSAVIAILIGLLVLLGYFFPALAGLQGLLLGWAMILAGAAALIGIFNLLSVHVEKIRRREKGSVYSVVLIASLIASFIAVFLALSLEIDFPILEIVIGGIILPAEAALMAILTVTLLYAAMRLLRRRLDLMSIVFLATVLFVLSFSATPPFGEVPVMDKARLWVDNVLSMGGARGILIGVALGTLTTGLRVLFAIDRPYGGK